eukprot:1030788-Amphidinium_carterae.1
MSGPHSPAFGRSRSPLAPAVSAQDAAFAAVDGASSSLRAAADCLDADIESLPVSPMEATSFGGQREDETRPTRSKTDRFKGTESAVAAAAAAVAAFWPKVSGLRGPRSSH